MKQVTTLIPRDFSELSASASNLYEVVAIIAQRAKQIAASTKKELDEKLAEFVPEEDSLDEIFENQEQIEISKFYETRPKPTTMAMEELKEQELTYHYAYTEEEDA